MWTWPRRGSLIFSALTLILTSCWPPYVVDCGPLPEDQCEKEAAEIANVVGRGHPDRSIVSITFLNRQAHAEVILDDGTEVGWGERD